MKFEKLTVTALALLSTAALGQQPASEVPA